MRYRSHERVFTTPLLNQNRIPKTVYIILRKYTICYELEHSSIFIISPQIECVQSLSPLICRSVYRNGERAHKSTMQILKLLNILFIYSDDRDNDDS